MVAWYGSDDYGQVFDSILNVGKQSRVTLKKQEVVSVSMELRQKA